MAKKHPSRRARWMDAASRAEAALSELVDLQAEYEYWRDNLPENLQQSAVAEKLETVCDLDLQSALDTVSDATGLDLPLGFGRD